MEPTIKRSKDFVIGYKAFRRDSSNRLYTDGKGSGTRMYWKKGDRKTIKGEIALCEHGFHFFREKDLCFAVDYLEPENAIYKIVARGDIIQDTYKCVTNDIEILDIVTDKILNTLQERKNSGDGNSGNRNSGHGNSGNRNSGHRNAGHENSGSGNSEIDGGSRHTWIILSGDPRWGDFVVWGFRSAKQRYE